MITLFHHKLSLCVIIIYINALEIRSLSYTIGYVQAGLIIKEVEY